MGTVGLSFGSATSGAGFDVNSTVTSILAVQQGIETPWKNQLSQMTAQDSALSTLGSDLSTLSTSLGALTAFDGVMYQKDGSSSDTSVVALSAANSNATAGSHAVTVSQLARTPSVYTSAVSANDTLSGSLTIQVGSGSAQTITVGSSNNTLSTLAQSINAANLGVTASLVADNSGTRLSITSNTSGTAGQITVGGSLTDATTSAAMTTQVGQPGQDAMFSVDGVSLTSGSNVVSTAIPGVTFQLLSTSSAPVQVAIATSNNSIESAMSSFVTAYNAVVTAMKGQEGKDASGNAEPLYGSPVLAQMQMSMSSALMSGAASGAISSIAQLGLSVNQDGTLSLSASTLDSALNQHFNDVLGFLQNSGSFGQNFATALNGLSATNTNGALYLVEQQNQTAEASLNQNISDEEARLATQKTTLTTELSRANQILQAIPSQLNQVNEMYSAITGYNSSHG